MIEETLASNEIIARLKFIASIQQHDKLNLRSLSFDRNQNMWTSMKRYLTSESRNQCLVFVQSTINQAFSVLHTMIDNDISLSWHVCRLLIKDLQLCNHGIANLEVTYQTDSMFCAKLTTLRESTMFKVEDLLNSHPKLRLQENHQTKTSDSKNKPKHQA